MNRVNLYEAKTRFSALIERVSAGETVVICKRNVPAAELRPIAKVRLRRRPVGLVKGFTTPPSFFAPLPQDLVDAFAGR